jgi:hypothetical protein
LCKGDEEEVEGYEDLCEEEGEEVVCVVKCLLCSTICN